MSLLLMKCKRDGAMSLMACPSNHRPVQKAVDLPLPTMVNVDMLKNVWTSLEVENGSSAHARVSFVCLSHNHLA
jgi:hypothetical protein